MSWHFIFILILSATFKAIRDEIEWSFEWSWLSRLSDRTTSFLKGKAGRWVPLDGWHTFDALSYFTLYVYALILQSGLTWSLLWKIPLSWEIFYFFFSGLYHYGLRKKPYRENWITKSITVFGQIITGRKNVEKL
ncbi:MAG: hypothetical protein AMQ22_00212 [Candidatus Methanofastidiosum methylothiophilum]|uniref:Uncharacterized protein n=1 Tax=Candidatus Methanofastidiosum methylothiophilum TaxID=1705564 RepID=A0A150J8L4_9EURY|nr:MAG: hypothetical protein APG11_00830 [Candidatus Methanofastidiosum methylthiophilus]KYC53541.1 MAG: hypothetical protein AMQ22_00212 [Candidatus Methanofastidiosum methylthiophilus]